MSVGELRTFLKSWLSKRIRIDKWGLSLPDSIDATNKPTSIGLDKPALNISVIKSEGWGSDKVAVVETTIPFQIIYRFSSAYQYNNIPRADAETLLSNLLIETDGSNCLPSYILSLRMSGSVSVAEHKNGDQLLLFEIDFLARIEAEIKPLNQIYDPSIT
jgi:hypothetical protein